MAHNIKAFLDNHKDISIALDADQVLADAFPLVIEKVNALHGSDYTLNDLTEYPSPGKPFLNTTTEEFNRIYDEVWKNDWQKIPKLGRDGLISGLSTAFRTDIVSSRGEEAAGPLRSWLGLNYPGMGQNIVIVEKHSDKSILPYNIFIDDAPRLAWKIRDTEGKLLLLIDAPYNMGIGNSEKIMHFRDVNAACAELLRYSAHAMRGP